MGARLSRCRWRIWAAVLVAGGLLAGCGATPHLDPLSGVPRALLREARPIGHGPRFDPPVTGHVLGRCASGLGRRFGVHVEVFAANRVALLPAGIGTRPPRRYAGGRISGAACYGELVTIDPTGLVLVRPGRPFTIAALFRSWGQPLTSHRLASFTSLRPVAGFVNGHRWTGPAGGIPLGRHWEIVLEVGPHVPPHAAYAFPPGT